MLEPYVLKGTRTVLRREGGSNPVPTYPTILPVYDPSLEEKPKYKFKGIREERGLYKTQDGKYINADVNAAANIIKKRKHEFNYERLYKWVQTAPIKIKLQT